MADPIVPVPVPAPVLPNDEATAALVSATVKHHVAGMQAAFDAQLATLREQLAARGGAPAKTEPVTGTDDVSQLKSQLKSMQDQAASERKASRESKAFEDLRSELSGKVRPEGVNALAKLIMHAERLVTVADDGAVTFRHGDAAFNLKEGVAAYLRTPDAAMYLPAPNGTAQRPGTRVPARTIVTGAAAPANETPIQKTLRLLAGLKA